MNSMAGVATRECERKRQQSKQPARTLFVARVDAQKDSNIYILAKKMKLVLCVTKWIWFLRKKTLSISK